MDSDEDASEEEMESFDNDEEPPDLVSDTSTSSSESDWEEEDGREDADTDEVEKSRKGKTSRLENEDEQSWSDNHTHNSDKNPRSKLEAQVLPHGMVSGSLVFQRVMDALLEKDLHCHTCQYNDDLVIEAEQSVIGRIQRMEDLE